MCKRKYLKKGRKKNSFTIIDFVQKVRMYYPTFSLGECYFFYSFKFAAVQCNASRGTHFFQLEESK